MQRSHTACLEKLLLNVGSVYAKYFIAVNKVVVVQCC